MQELSPRVAKWVQFSRNGNLGRGGVLEELSELFHSLHNYMKQRIINFNRQAAGIPPGGLICKLDLFSSDLPLVEVLL